MQWSIAWFYFIVESNVLGGALNQGNFSWFNRNHQRCELLLIHFDIKIAHSGSIEVKAEYVNAEHESTIGAGRDVESWRIVWELCSFWREDNLPLCCFKTHARKQYDEDGKNSGRDNAARRRGVFRLAFVAEQATVREHIHPHEELSQSRTSHLSGKVFNFYWCIHSLIHLISKQSMLSP